MMPHSILVFCSKSRWRPAIRREHALAAAAARAGHAVAFIEAPLDVRALLRRGERRPWLAGWRTSRLRPRSGAVRVVPTATLLPGHRSLLAELLDARRLSWVLRRIDGISSAVLITSQPWQWRGLTRSPGRWRVFDSTDDWSVLIPRRRHALSTLQRRIGVEADALIAVSERMRDSFIRDPVVVPNGTGSELLARAVTPRPRARRMIYAGTLSERLDWSLVCDLMAALPDWELDIVGPANFATGSGDLARLDALLAGCGARVRRHGAVERDELVAFIDAADVAVIPHRGGFGAGQSSMKLYDYAARGRPIVAAEIEIPPDAPRVGLALVQGATAFARAVRDAEMIDDAVLEELRSWAERQRWEVRWTAWAAAAMGAA